MNSSNQTEGAYKTAFNQSRMRLQALKPSEIVDRSLCKFDKIRDCFVLDSFGHKIEISYSDGKVRFFDTNTELPLDWALILLNYLSSAKAVPLVNEIVTYRELPLGNVFYPHIKTHVLDVLGDFYSDCKKDRLINVFKKMGFVSVESKADLGMDGSFTPRVPVMVRFWEGEEGIPSSCQLLFDRTVSEHMHIEDIAALCGVIKYLILTQYQKS